MFEDEFDLLEEEDIAGHTGKILLKHMRDNGLDGFGGTISLDEIYRVIGITLPEKMSMSEMNAISLAVLKATGYVRSVLVDEGKYFGQNKGAYRIRLPSENKGVIDSYIRASKKKSAFAQKLFAATPVDTGTNQPSSNDGVRAFMMAQTRRSVFGDVRQ